MKRLLFSVIPVLILSAALLVSCGGGGSGGGESNSPTPEDEVKAAAEQFLTAMSEGDIDTIKAGCEAKLLEDDSELGLYANLPNELSNALLEGLGTKSLGEKSKASIEKFAKEYMTEFLKSYEIKETSVDGDTAKVSVDVVYGYNPNKIEDIDTTSILSESEIEDYANEHKDELKKYIDSGDQEGFLNAVLDGVLDKLLDGYMSEIKKTGELKDKMTLSMAKQDDKWIVTGTNDK